MKALIFGAGVNGRQCRDYIKSRGEHHIVGFLDNGFEKLQEIEAGRVHIYPPEKVSNLDYERVMISNAAPDQIAEIKAQQKDFACRRKRGFNI